MDIPKKVRGFTFIQTYDPTSSETVTGGDTWFDPTLEYVRVWDDTKNRWTTIIDGKGYGYICGGNDGIGDTFSTITERIEFASDSSGSIQTENMLTACDRAAACNSTNYGYIIGGSPDGTVTIFSTITRFSFPFSSGTMEKVGNLSGSIVSNSGCNSSIYGYSIGGYVTSSRSVMYRISFPFDSGTAPSNGNISGIRNGGSGFNSSTHGYSAGGHNDSSHISIIDRIAFPHDSGIASTNGNLSLARNYSSGFNSSMFGYISGGWTGSYHSIINRLIFPFENGTTKVSGNLSEAKYASAGINSSKAGYIVGGRNSTDSSIKTIENVIFSFDNGTSNIVSNILNRRRYSNGLDTTDFNRLFA